MWQWLKLRFLLVHLKCSAGIWSAQITGVIHIGFMCIHSIIICVYHYSFTKHTQKRTRSPQWSPDIVAATRKRDTLKTRIWLLAAIRYGAYQTITGFFAGSIITFLVAHSSSSLTCIACTVFTSGSADTRVTVFVKECISLTTRTERLSFSGRSSSKGRAGRILLWTFRRHSGIPQVTGASGERGYVVNVSQQNRATG